MMAMVSPVDQGRRYDLYLILEDDNIARLKEYDPARFEERHMPPKTHGKIRDVIIAYVSPKDLPELERYVRSSNAEAAHKLLHQGFRFRPEAGDKDAPYQSLKHKPK